MVQQALSAPAAQQSTGLAYQRCRWCGTASVRRLLCPVCASSDMTAERSDGRGVLVRPRGVGAASADEYLVRFTEGFVLRCRVSGVKPGLMHAGAHVRVTAAPPQPGRVDVEVCHPGRRGDLSTTRP